jgi:hypothetical protein
MLPSTREIAGKATLKLIDEQVAKESDRKASLEQRGQAVIISSGLLVALLFGLSTLATKAVDFTLPGVAAIFLAVAAIGFLGAAGMGLLVGWRANTKNPRSTRSDACCRRLGGTVNSATLSAPSPCGESTTWRSLDISTMRRRYG